MLRRLETLGQEASLEAELNAKKYGLRYFVIKIFMQMKESANTEREM